MRLSIPGGGARRVRRLAAIGALGTRYSLLALGGGRRSGQALQSMSGDFRKLGGLGSDAVENLNALLLLMPSLENETTSTMKPTRGGPLAEQGRQILARLGSTEYTYIQGTTSTVVLSRDRDLAVKIFDERCIEAYDDDLKLLDSALVVLARLTSGDRVQVAKEIARNACILARQEADAQREVAAVEIAREVLNYEGMQQVLTPRVVEALPDANGYVMDRLDDDQPQSSGEVGVQLLRRLCIDIVLKQGVFHRSINRQNVRLTDRGVLLYDLASFHRLSDRSRSEIRNLVVALTLGNQDDTTVIVQDALGISGSSSAVFAERLADAVAPIFASSVVPEAELHSPTVAGIAALPVLPDTVAIAYFILNLLNVAYLTSNLTVG